MGSVPAMGGYRRISVVTAAALWRLAQARLRATVRFARTTGEQARYALAEEYAQLRQIEAAMPTHEERMRRLSRAAQGFVTRKS